MSELNLWARIASFNVIEHNLWQYCCDQSVIYAMQTNKLTFTTYSLYPCKKWFNDIKIRQLQQERILSLHSMPSITKLSIRETHLMKEFITNSITDIRFEAEFNQFIPLLPNSLLRLTFGRKFNQPLIPGSLPNSLKVIHFGQEFNQIIIDCVIPKSLIHLTFGVSFNQQLNPGVLGNSLIHLSLGYHFNEEIDLDVLPNTLTYLSLGFEFNQVLQPHVLPPSLRTLMFSHHYNYIINQRVFPSSLTDITMSHRFNYPLLPMILPHSLIRLIIGFAFNQEICMNVLPNSLEELEFGDRFNSSINSNALPSSLIKLTFGHSFNQPLTYILPPSLTYLHTGFTFDQDIISSDFSSLNHFSHGSKKNLISFLPPNTNKIPKSFLKHIKSKRSQQLLNRPCYNTGKIMWQSDNHNI